MKRILTAVTALLLALSLVACSTIERTPIEELMSDIQGANENLEQNGGEEISKPESLEESSEEESGESEESSKEE